MEVNLRYYSEVITAYVLSLRLITPLSLMSTTMTDSRSKTLEQRPTIGCKVTSCNKINFFFSILDTHIFTTFRPLCNLPTKMCDCMKIRLIFFFNRKISLYFFCCFHVYILAVVCGCVAAWTHVENVEWQWEPIFFCLLKRLRDFCV